MFHLKARTCVVNRQWAEPERACRQLPAAMSLDRLIRERQVGCLVVRR